MNSSSSSSSSPSAASSTSAKKQRVQQLFHDYFLQVTQGCGRVSCPIVHCASSAEDTPLPPKPVRASSASPTSAPPSSSSPFQSPLAPPTSYTRAVSAMSPPLSSPSAASPSSSSSASSRALAPTRVPVSKGPLAQPHPFPKRKLEKKDAAQLAVRLLKRGKSAEQEVCPRPQPGRDFIPDEEADKRLSGERFEQLYAAAVEQAKAEGKVPASATVETADASLLNLTPLVRAIGSGFGDAAVLDSSFTFAKPPTLVNGGTGTADASTSAGHVWASADLWSPGIDFDSVDRAFKVIRRSPRLISVTQSSFHRLSSNILVDRSPAYIFQLRKIIIALYSPVWEDPERLGTFSKLCAYVGSRLNSAHVRILQGWFSRFSRARLEQMIVSLQQLISVRWLEPTPRNRMVPEQAVSAIKMMAVIHRASCNPTYHLLEPVPVADMLANMVDAAQPDDPAAPAAMDIDEQESPSARAGQAAAAAAAAAAASSSSPSSSPATASVSKSAAPRLVPSDWPQPDSPLYGLHSQQVYTIDGGTGELDAYGEIVPADAFYNDAANNEPQLARFTHAKWLDGEFSLMSYPFLVDASQKNNILKQDAMQQMRNRFRESLHQLSRPYLVLEVERGENLIRDTLQQLSGRPPTDFKKPLKVKFVGEAGVDEGGVRKEFFQLVVAEIFVEGYDMFVYDEATQLHWFNPNTFTSNVEFELIGKIVGLAIYNSVILDVRFPRALYKKLLGWPIGFKDFAEIKPDVASNLRKLLNFDEGDVEDVFALDFTVNETVFGAVKTIELKPGGADIPVTNANRQEYVELYIQHYVETSIERQFNAFKLGFDTVCGGPALEIVRPDELDLIVCGSSEFDMHSLERGTRYDGFDEDSPTVRHFWNAVYRLTEQEQKQLLAFVTGSDRVPIRGLEQLKLTISRNGPDSDRLPTSHTCFNHLLLPDYQDEAKLERLLKIAIRNSKGFGLL